MYKSIHLYIGKGLLDPSSCTWSSCYFCTCIMIHLQTEQLQNKNFGHHLLTHKFSKST